MQRQGWSDNGHIKVDWIRVKAGDVVDRVNVVRKACALRFGPPVWYVLMVQPNSEAQTVERLADAGIRIFFPKVYKWRQTKEILANLQRRQEKVPLPMFPGYVFVDRRNGLDEFSEPLAVKGVRDYLWAEAVDEYGRPTRKPRQLPRGLYEAILAREAERSVKADEDRMSPFKAGEVVRIKDGPFRDMLAKVERSDDKGRVDLLMEIFAGPTLARMDAVQLERTEQPTAPLAGLRQIR